MAPGSTVTREPTMFFETGKFDVSKTLIEPPLKGVALSADSLYVNGLGTVPAGPEGSGSLAEGGADCSLSVKTHNRTCQRQNLPAGKIYSSVDGM